MNTSNKQKLYGYIIYNSARVNKNYRELKKIPTYNLSCTNFGSNVKHFTHGLNFKLQTIIHNSYCLLDDKRFMHIVLYKISVTKLCY